MFVAGFRYVCKMSEVPQKTLQVMDTAAPISSKQR